jgi:PPM family protein phosphatase
VSSRVVLVGVEVAPTRGVLGEEGGAARLVLGRGAAALAADVAWRTSRGARGDNQDAVLVAVADGGLLVGVFDGVGGQSGGGAASWVAARSFADALRTSGPPRGTDGDWLARAMSRAHGDVRARAREDRTKGLTTATVALLGVAGAAEASLAHVGDSRAYRWGGGSLRQITSDHTMVEALARSHVADGMNREEALRVARASGWDHVVVGALGDSDEPEVDVALEAFRPGDSLLLSTDGLHGFVDDRRVADALASDRGSDEVVRSLVEDAHAAPSDDNVSVVVVRFVGPGRGGVR